MVDVIHRRVLWSPDFPRIDADADPRPSRRLADASSII